MSFVRDRRGQTTASGVVSLLLLVVVAAGLVDGLSLLSTRQRCLAVASAAALRGVSRGRDYDAYLGSGQIALDTATAQTEVTSAVNDSLAAMGLSGYTVRVEVLDVPGGGSIADFPPGRMWVETEPAVGVYLVVPVDTALTGMLLAGSSTVDVHVFAAAGVSMQ